MVYSFEKKVITITNAFQDIIDESKQKPNKICMNKSKEFYNRSIKSWLQYNYMEMCSIHHGEKYVAAERFIRVLKNKPSKHMTSITKMCISINQLIQLMNTAIHIIHNQNTDH